MTVKELFHNLCEQLQASKVFYGHGVTTAEDEVLLLMMKMLAVDFETLNQMTGDAVSPEVISAANQLLEERIKTQKPMAYVLGFSVFAGLDFKVDERALVPRSPFVQLIDCGFSPWVNMDEVKGVLDLCTGSGCIGLAIAHYFKHCQVDLSDLSEDALSLAKENQQALALNSHTQLIHSDLFESLDKQYDLIVTNPPYVDETEYKNLPQEFIHEPKMALVSERDGLEIPVKILSQAADYLTEAGYLFLEVGFYDQALTTALPNVDFMWLDFSSDETDDFLGDGQGICVFSKADLLKFKPYFEEFLNTHVTQ
ncbi:50S ribosomal protein L3 N(5)-glutamine methyltransferase [Marinicella rhabdoformis]|uniref:50S ribosomal protein L3 N(5)-glutamine methyltransferase n=1 Tax=Marinicella rhabdoformis TaxID=2580566 RepID=UPI0015D08883|nr:50S ribosomal protein L3 N(5)-glutamine methyltransferase [Marinicella rhabdoformis]